MYTYYCFTLFLFHQSTQDFFGEEFPFFTHSYSTPLHLLSSLPDCCVILRPQVGNGDWLVTAVGSIVNGTYLPYGNTDI